MTMRVFYTFLRGLLCAVMVAAGLGKFLAEQNDVLNVVFQVESNLGRWLLASVERSVSPVEVLVGLGLFHCRTTKSACVVGIALSLGFLGLAFALPHGIECACFGVLGGFSSAAAHATVAFVLLAGFLVTGWVAASRPRT